MMLAGPTPRVAQHTVSPPVGQTGLPARAVTGPPPALPPRRPARLDTYLTYAATALALLPLPLSLFDVLPGYRVSSRFLAVYTTLLALIALGYVWYVRHQIARLLLGVQRDLYLRDEAAARGEQTLRWRVRPVAVALLPLALIGLSVFSLLHYQTRFRDSVASTVGVTRVALAQARTAADSAAVLDLGTDGRLPQREADLRRAVLTTAGIDTIADFGPLCLFYLGAFVPAVVGVTFMAVRERMQRELEISDVEMILGPEDESVAEESTAYR
jgi:hypothetical protein